MAEEVTQDRFGKYRKTAVKAIGELALIIVGILGAFAIEDWQEQQKQKTLVKETITITFAELASNHCALIRAHKHQSEIKSILSKFKDASTEQEYTDIYRSMYRIGIIQPALLMSAAWETAIATGVVRHIPIKDATLIAPFYYHAKSYERLSERFSSEMMKSDFREGSLESELNGIMGGNNALWWREKYQLNMYKQHFTILTQKYGFVAQACKDKKGK